MNILVHHHAGVFIEENGQIFIQSFIGRWVNALSGFCQVGLLVYTTPEKKPNQDVILNESVKIHSLGFRTTFQQRRQRFGRIRDICHKIKADYDVLLIRGITPDQIPVWKYSQQKLKAFLLVGSLRDSKPKFRIGMVAMIRYFMYYRRLRELRQITDSGLMLANSHLAILELKEIFQVNAHFIPTNSISINDFKPFQNRDLHSPLRLLFCGRIVPEKGILELLEAIKDLKKGGMEIKLEVVGTLKNPFSRELFDKINKYSLQEDINFTGYIPFGEALFDKYRNSDLFLLPSYHEGFPHSFWEASMAGIPSIITEVGGVRGFLTHEKEAYLIEIRSSKAIEEAIQELMNDSYLRSQIAQNAYSFSKKYTIEKCALALIQLLNKEISYHA